MEKDINTTVGEMKILKQFIHNRRMYVRISVNGSKSKLMLRSAYMWLKHNPGFDRIPKRYVIHHLDGDPWNDDPSNLALMYRCYHSAYHAKNRTAPPNTPIEIDVIDLGEPLSRPRATYYKSRGFWILRYSIRENGQKVAKSTYRLNMHTPHWKTKWAAEAAIEKIWPDKPWEKYLEMIEKKGKLYPD